MNPHGRTGPRLRAQTLRWTRLMALVAGFLLVGPALQAQDGPAPVEGDTLLLVETELASDKAPLFPVTTVLPPGSHPNGFVFTQAAEADLSAFSADRGLNVGTNVALMTVGVAAIGVGLLIGGDAGTVVAVAGGGIALLGLYRFVR
jgi:hypothetical protein